MITKVTMIEEDVHVKLINTLFENGDGNRNIQVKVKQDFYYFADASTQKLPITLYSGMSDLLIRHLGEIFNVTVYVYTHDTVYVMFDGWNFPIEVFDVICLNENGKRNYNNQLRSFDDK